MSWIGKILAVLGLLLALVWMWFTATTFAARTNWKTRSDNYEAAYKQAKDAREGEYRTFQAERDALARQLKSAETRADTATAQLKKAEADLAKAADDYAKLNESAGKRDVLVAEHQANAAANQPGRTSSRCG